MNPLLKEIYATQTVKDASDNPISIYPTSVLYEEGAAIYKFIQQNKSTKTLEIGLAYGLSTLFFCQALEDVNSEGMHTAFDPLEHSLWQSIGLLNIERANLNHRLNYFDGYSHEILPQLLAQKQKFDFVFVDGAHLFDHVMLDFYYVNLLTQQGGFVMLHDLWMPSVRKLLAFVLRNLDYEIVNMQSESRTPFWRPLTRSFKIFLQSPSDIQAWSLPFRLKNFTLFTSNYCMLRKVGSSERTWDHYCSF